MAPPLLPITRLVQCSGCDEHVKRGEPVCPHCGALVDGREVPNHQRDDREQRLPDDQRGIATLEVPPLQLGELYLEKRVGQREVDETLAQGMRPLGMQHRVEHGKHPAVQPLAPHFGHVA